MKVINISTHHNIKCIVTQEGNVQYFIESNNMKTKRCSSCKTDKDLNSFCKNRSHKDGLHHICKDCHNAATIAYQKRDPEAIKKRMQRYRSKLKKEVFDHYGGMQCALCDNDDERVLTIDHIHGGGNQHRKTIPISGIYCWLRKNGYPDGFRVLCMNCQFIQKTISHNNS